MKLRLLSLSILLLSLLLTACESNEECFHDYGEWNVIQKVTCTENGLQSHVCRKCGYEEQVEKTAYGHSERLLHTVPATCLEKGLSEGRECSICGELLVSQYDIEATGHTESVLEAVEPTCTESGLTEGRICESCGTILLEQDSIDATGHVEEILEKVLPTCAESGLTEGKQCSICKAILQPQEIIAPKGHKEIVLQAVAMTCTKDGLTAGKKCKTCGEIIEEQKVIKSTGHQVTTVQAVAATCTSNGHTAGKSCSKCGAVIEATTAIPALGHNYSNGKCTICKAAEPHNGSIILPSVPVTYSSILGRGCTVISMDCKYNTTPIGGFSYTISASIMNDITNKRSATTILWYDIVDENGKVMVTNGFQVPGSSSWYDVEVTYDSKIYTWLDKNKTYYLKFQNI